MPRRRLLPMLILLACGVAVATAATSSRAPSATADESGATCKHPRTALDITNALRRGTGFWRLDKAESEAIILVLAAGGRRVLLHHCDDSRAPVLAYATDDGEARALARGCSVLVRAAKLSVTAPETHGWFQIVSEGTAEERLAALGSYRLDSTDPHVLVDVGAAPAESALVHNAGAADVELEVAGGSDPLRLPKRTTLLVVTKKLTVRTDDVKVEQRGYFSILPRAER